MDMNDVWGGEPTHGNISKSYLGIREKDSFVFL